MEQPDITSLVWMPFLNRELPTEIRSEPFEAGCTEPYHQTGMLSPGPGISNELYRRDMSVNAVDR